MDDILSIEQLCCQNSVTGPLRPTGADIGRRQLIPLNFLSAFNTIQPPLLQEKLDPRLVS